MINIDILNKGDEVICLNEHFLGVRRKNGAVDIFNVFRTEVGEVGIDPVKAARIDYGTGLVKQSSDDGKTTIIEF